MFGYTALLNSNRYTFKTEGRNDRVMCCDDYLCYNNMIDKFGFDKLFYQNDEFMLMLDGIVLNKSLLLTDSKTSLGGGGIISKEFHDSSWIDYILNQYRQRGDSFFDLFRGSFSGVLYDKKKNKYICFTDQLGSKFVYYIKLENALFVSSMMSECYSFLQQNRIEYNISRDSAYLLLTYGYMLEDRTLCEEIKKIDPGCYITLENGILKKHQYFKLNNEPDYSIKEEDAIEIIDEEFRRSVDLQFKKDAENGYHHLVALSAGLDSRMVSWVAHELGFTHQQNFTFSQTGYWDEIVPRQIAAYLKHDWIFKSLDGGWWLEDVEPITKITGGNVLYYGLAHGRSLVDVMDLKSFGMLHSGQLGDVVFASHSDYSPYKLGQGAYSTKYLEKIENVKIPDYPNEEIGLFYTRYLNGTNNGLVNNYNYSEVVSPFHDIDLLRRTMQIPLPLKKNHNIYVKWILEKFPEAAKFVWEKWQCRIDRRYGFVTIRGKRLRLESLPKRILVKLGFLRTDAESGQDMNPIGYYIRTNQELGQWINDYLRENIDRVEDKELKNDLLAIATGNGSIEKIQALSLLAALKMFY